MGKNKVIVVQNINITIMWINFNGRRDPYGSHLPLCRAIYFPIALATMNKLRIFERSLWLLQGSSHLRHLLVGSAGMYCSTF